MFCRISRSLALFVIAFLLLSNLRAFADAPSVIYVDRKGDDANPGTTERPVRSVEALSRRLWKSGDAVYFRGGQSFTGALTLHGGGSDSKPVVVGSFGSGRATIDSAGENLFFGYNQGGFQFQDLNLKSSSKGETAGGILFYSDSPVGARYPGVTIKNCDIRGFGGPGIKIGSWHPSNPGWARVRVESCHVTGNGEGMAVYGYDAPAGNSYSIGTITVTKSEFASNRGAGLSICGVSSGTVDLCSFHENQRLGGCWTWAARNITIQRCISYRNRRGKGNDGFGFDIDGGSVGCTIQYCLSYENDTAGFAIFDYPNSADTVDNTIRYCISENDVRSDREGGSFEINPWANTPIRNSYIYNCAAYLTSHGARSLCSGFKGIGRRSPYGYQSGEIASCGFWNNVIYLSGGGSDLRHLNCQRGAVDPSEIAFQGNNYASSTGVAPRIAADGVQYNSLSWWRASTRQERLRGHSGVVETGLCADPIWGSAGGFHRITDPALMARSTTYRLSPSSPCFRTGLDLKKLFSVEPGRSDFFGNPIRPSALTNLGPAGPESTMMETSARE